MNKKTNDFREGNFTVECALLMPVILLCIVSVLWLSINLYNVNAMHKALIHGLLASEYYPDVSNNKLKNIIEDRIREEMKGSLVGTDNVEIKVKVSKLECEASAEAVLNLPEGITGLSELRLVKVSDKIMRLEPARTVQDMKKVENIYEYIMEYLKEESD